MAKTTEKLSALRFRALGQESGASRTGHGKAIEARGTRLDALGGPGNKKLTSGQM
jgi:hypothetical protein